MKAMRSGLFMVAFFLSAASATAQTVSAADQPAPGRCPDANELPFAFWLGRWDVYAGDTLGGHSFIENVLDGCAVIEHWDDTSGFKGMSLFYLEPHAGQWKQVWVTDHARRPGGTKEKFLIHASADSVRFQGTIWVAPDRMVLDRTTLHKLDGDRVSQIIEYSKDGGSTWIKTFDAIYRRPAVDGAPTH